ncbi:MAG: 2,3-cyclic 3-phosphodiesterase [Solirubrobacteraceae bacterium]|nr:2,3-cyclic 3-phosphodiesterase [Solirubrobacteraceae bacterium]
MSEPRLRLFVALDLPPEVRAELARWCARVAPAGVRHVPAQNLHVTLAFLGSRGEHEAAAVAGLLADVAAACPLGTLATAGALWLPPRRPGVLTVAIAASAERAQQQRDPADGGLALLRTALVDALRTAIGFEPERRAFRPHVTVGRVGRGAHVAAGALDPPPVLAFTPQTLTLYRSLGGPGGARYTALARAPASC